MAEQTQSSGPHDIDGIRSSAFRNDVLRRSFSATLVLAVLVLLVISQFLDAVDVPVANAVANVGILLLGGVLLEQVASLGRGVRSLRETMLREPALFVYEKEGEAAKQRQVKYIEEHPPRTAKLWEHSAYTARHVYEALANCDRLKVIQVLVADPRHASRWHRETRILPTLQDLQINFSRRSDVDLQIRCYRIPSIRGRNFDDKLIVLGCYTYDPRPELGSGGPPLWGAHNPVFIGDSTQPEVAGMRAGFNAAFDTMWSADSVGVFEAVEPYLDSFSAEQRVWLRKVGPPREVVEPVAVTGSKAEGPVG